MAARSLWESLGFAWAGVRHVVATQRNARIHFALAVVVAIVAAWLRVDRRDWALLILAIGIVLAAEFVNTVVESIVDLVSPEYHVLARIAKDVSAGAVLVMAVAAIIVGLCILAPPLWQRLVP